MTGQSVKTEGPRGRSGSLVSVVSGRLRERILGGALKAGDKLPSEARLTEAFGVSRTVVREAIAALRADGLVEPRQGAGVFVLAPRAALPFQGVVSSKISSIIEMLELRVAVEGEAAALAAQRRSPAQDEAIREAFDALEQAVAQGRSTMRADFAFHQAVAEATNNPRFCEFLTLMGARAIPRSTLQDEGAEAVGRDYLAQIQREHRAIAEAISARDEEGARAAMRAHLIGSQQRYRTLLREG